MAESKDLRALFLQTKTFRTRDVEVDLPTGKTVVRIRQATVEERNRITSAASNKTGQGLSEAQALAVILCVRNPQGEGRVFEESDLKDLMEAPAGSWVDELAGEVMTLIAEGSEAAKK